MLRTLLAVAILFAGGCSLFEGGDTSGGAVEPPPASVAAGEGEIVVQGIAFNPARAEVPAGREVVWTFADNGLTHTVTADDASFDSGRMTAGEFRQTFTTAGEIAYHCEVHARMKGTVVVR